MSTTDLVALPPLDGSIPLFYGFLDFHARHNADKPFYVFPYPDTSSSNIVELSFLEFAHATHRVAHWLRPTRSGTDGEVVAMIANCDVMYYVALLIGMNRSGLVPFPMSPRNSAPAIASMIERTGCKRLICQPAFSKVIADVCAALPPLYTLKVDWIVPFSEIFPTIGLPPNTVAPPNPYPTAPRAHSASDIVQYLHSSGSTGFPKPIAERQVNMLNNGIMLSHYRDKLVRWGGMALPPFHFMGTVSQMIVPLISGQATALFPPCAPEPPLVPTPENTIETARRTHVTTVLAVPVFVEAWIRSEENVKFLAGLNEMMFSGGPLSPAASTKLAAAGVPLGTTYASTEAGIVARSISADDPALAGLSYPGPLWFRIIDRISPRWVPEGDGTYELQLLSCSTHQPCVENLPDGERGYATSDLFAPHPTIPDLWRITGRKDDVIVLSTGEKTVPIAAEGHMNGHPFIAGAVMFGHGHEQVGVLIEPHSAHAVTPGDEEALVAFRDAIWPQVEEANHLVAAFSRVFKEMILVADPARPLPRAAKSTVIRKQALALYEKDIDALLSATFLRNRIIGALRASTDTAAQAVYQHVQPNFVYSHPTLESLAHAVAELVQPGSLSQSSTVEEEMEKLITRYTALLPSITPNTVPAHTGRAVVLLTGTTGALGSHILAELLTNPQVSRIYALNRGVSLAERQRARFEAVKLPTALLADNKLVLLSGDLTRDDLGLEPAVLEEIRTSVTHVVHNAWRVDFNLALASFEPYIAGAIRLLRLAPHRHFLFTSSIAAAQGWRSASRVPEAPLADAAPAAGSGYGASKHVVEHVLANARKAGLRTTTARIGQICGPATSGAWSTAEWVPGLVKSSGALGCLPLSPGMVAWVPMDAVAAALVDVVLGADPPLLVNVVHPRPVPWQEAFGWVNGALGLALPFVPFHSWVKKLEDKAEGIGAVELEAVPAIKILEFYQGIAKAGQGDNGGGDTLFETVQAERASQTLATLPPLGKEHVAAWIAYWRSQQFIP
ncbi:hypothetical protein B0H21DRAFT_862505 [Amylocystis lapponica]|nr:hypothetical protein B0H21DRAFT_862505 [Amylocystis lapponica]